ncbi:MAG: RNA polymerase-associated protein RapA [Gammaproteobacteria bacterium]|nr:RNA polymerase-associated protein RapA [Gammaproteobacteria bacterium]
MPEFIRGQRWINDARLEMGLGTVIATDRRTVTIIFHAAEETLTYASDNAPLTRVRFARGDHISGNDETSLRIESVKERDGLLSYIGRNQSGNSIELHETDLNHRMQLNRPAERLFFGQIDDSKWFDLRYRTLLQQNRLAASDLRGLTGCRTSLIPHQLYIAHEVANRYAPRVLLADEVGLGKTIEAGLILHHQLITERAHRILIIVPESLQFQWLVEMQRRFNLSFKIFDEGRCEALEESTLDTSIDSSLNPNTLTNPFHTEQLVLCSLEFLSRRPERALQCLDGEWDLLVVDEAHHLIWTPLGSSPEYRMIERLAATTKGVLLLTATPEQLGKESHFARLRLLDPERFPDFDAFIKEEADFEPIANAVEQLLESKKPGDATFHLLQEMIPEGDNLRYIQTLQSARTGSEPDTAARSALVEHLLDRHGAGRVLFRNTRAAVKGFPQRRVFASELPLPEAYKTSIEASSPAEVEPRKLLAPELLYQSVKSPEEQQWTLIDPRIHWLIQLLRSHKAEKFLVIASTAATAIDLVHALRDQAGIHAALFHEGLNLVERDRAAAFFADRERGSQLLVCSEIGSEGRNFQFARHMVLFDLPLNPDLLEQRIGRLDRIGQSSCISIHIPILSGSAQQRLFRWYDEGLDAFVHYSAASNAVYVKQKAELVKALQQHNTHFDELVKSARTLHQQFREQMHRGRDRLLEYNSCRPGIADDLKQRALQQHQHSDLPGYMETIFDCFGIDSEDESADCRIIRPGREMLSGGFPGLPDEGMTLTYNREEALANEDIQFLSWDHPLVSGAMELISSSELGNCAFTAVKYAGAARGSLLMESLYTLDTASTDQLRGNRYLPPTIIRVVVDEDGGNHSQRLTHSHILNHQLSVARETATKVIRAKEKALRAMTLVSRQLAGTLAPDIISSAHQQAHKTLRREIHRLKALSQINPSVRPEEIHFFEHQLETITTILESSSLRLEAVRVLVAI